MDAFTADYLASLTSSLTIHIAASLRKRLRQALSGPEEEQALGRSLQAGLVALLTIASAQSPEETNLLADIFRTFFTDEDVGEEVGRELAAILKGKSLDLAALTGLFGEAGFDPETLPGLDFEQGIAAFTAAFISAAGEEPALLEIGLNGVRREEAGRAALKRTRAWLAVAMQAQQQLQPPASEPPPPATSWPTWATSAPAWASSPQWSLANHTCRSLNSVMSPPGRSG